MLGTEPTLVLTCDGAVSRGVGGWAFIAQEYGRVEVIFAAAGTVRPTTNQRMELEAARQALRWALHQHPARPTAVVSDSAYLVNCFTDGWHLKWAANGWRTSEGGEVANQDLWESLVHLTGPLVWYVHVRGHAGHPANELCDSLAQSAVDANLPTNCEWTIEDLSV